MVGSVVVGCGLAQCARSLGIAIQRATRPRTAYRTHGLESPVRGLSLSRTPWGAEFTGGVPRVVRDGSRGLDYTSSSKLGESTSG